MKASKIAYGLIIAIASVVVLMYLKSILVPLVFAVIVWFLMSEIKALMHKSHWIKKNIPGWVENILAFVVIFGVIGLVVHVMGQNVREMYGSFDVYKTNVDKMVASVNDMLGVDVVTQLSEYIAQMDFGNSVKNLVGSLSGALGDIFLVIIYVIFLLGEQSVIPTKIKEMYPTRDRFHSAHVMMRDINKSIGNYLALKTLASLLTGSLSLIALLIIGVDFPFFWAIVIFLFNYIPAIGSLLGTVLVAIMSLLQFGDWMYFILVLGAVGAIQVVIGNLVEPRIVGNSLNISPLVVLLSLAFWGTIWGVAGMVLCVPITVMMIIIFSRFESTRNIAILLSGNGKVGQ